MKKKRSNFSRCGYDRKSAEKYRRRIANMSDEQLARVRARNAEYQRKRREKRTQQEVDDDRRRDARRHRESHAIRKTRKRCDNNDNDIPKSVNNFVYKCFWPKCDTSFSSNYSLLCHLRTSHSKQSENVDNVSDDDVHIKLKRTKNGESGDDFEIHVNANESSDELHVCDECDQTFKTVRLLNDHTIVHMKNPFKCDFCDHRYDTINELLDHRAVEHFNKKLVICKECGYKAESKAVHSHLRRVHKKEKNFICEHPDCNKAFFSKHCLEHHRQRLHSNERFDCIWPGCERSFKSVSYLNAHLKWHSGYSKFQCNEPECFGKIFSTESALNIHRQCVHSDEKPFACDWPGCCARFKTKSFLSIHVKGVHYKPDVKNANDRKFKCPQCDYRATSKPMLAMHNTRVHRKVKKFICDVPQCNGKSFCAKRELNDHKNSVHSDKRPFVCDWPQCNSAFKLKNNLKIHIKKVHTRI